MFFKKIIEDRLQKVIRRISVLSGGDINDVYKLETPEGTFLLKCNERERYPKMLQKEARGLNLLASGGVVSPKVLDCFEKNNHQFLILEYFDQAHPGHDFWKKFGEDLARLHQHSHPKFGLDHSNFIGSLPQTNEFSASWEEFFVESRLKPLMVRAHDNNLISDKHLKLFENLFQKIPELLPEERPALLHGDLWSGNLLCGKGGTPVFIDPAVYFGHREMDIAMTFMFGGFNREYLSEYNMHYPLEKGWENRVPIYNLYPNLVHLNLFGMSYLGNIERVLDRFN
jgi:protein-ribulosamine 3-kinase